MLYFLVRLDGVCTNTAHLLSFAKQNFSVQMTHKSTLLSLTFRVPLSPSAISSLTASLLSQIESTIPLISSDVLLSWQSLGLNDPRPRKYSLFVFPYDCRSSGELFTVSDITGHYWKGRRVKLSFLWTLRRYRYFKFWKTGREGLPEAFTSIVTRISTLYFLFQGGCWIDFNSV